MTLQALGQIMPLASLIRKLTGTGRMTSGFPARSAMWRYRGTPFSAAPALQTARDTPKMALAPNLAEIGTEILHFPEEIQQYQHRHGLGKVSAQHKPFTLLETTCSTSDLYNSLNTKPTYICSLFHPFPASVCLSFLAPPHWHSAERNRQNTVWRATWLRELPPAHCSLVSLAGIRNCLSTTTNSNLVLTATKQQLLLVTSNRSQGWPKLDTSKASFILHIQSYKARLLHCLTADRVTLLWAWHGGKLLFVTPAPLLQAQRQLAYKPICNSMHTVTTCNHFMHYHHLAPSLAARAQCSQKAPMSLKSTSLRFL